MDNRLGLDRNLLLLDYYDFDFECILQQPSIVEHQAGGGKEAGRSSRPADS